MSLRVPDNVSIHEYLGLNIEHYYMEVPSEDSHPTCRRTYYMSRDGAVEQYLPISTDITKFLAKHGYTITGLLGRSSADVFLAVKDGKEYAVVMCDTPPNKGAGAIYKSLVGKTNPYLATVYLYQVIGSTTVVVEEKAIMTLAQLCRQMKSISTPDKLNLIRGAYAWSVDVSSYLAEEEMLCHNDSNLDNIAVFEENGQHRLKYIDLDSLRPYTVDNYALESWNLLLMVSLLFD